MCIKSVREMSDKALFAEVFGVREDTIRFDRIGDLMTAPRAIDGIGERKADKIYAVREMARRIMAQEAQEPEQIHGPQDVADFLQGRLGYETREHFMVVVLDAKNHILAVSDVSIGSLSASVVHPREVFREALKYPVASIILVHNHPSGSPSPSREDVAVTQRLVKAGKILDVPVLDHIIIGGAGSHKWMSLKEKGFII